MNDSLKMYGSIGLEIMNRYFVVAMCFKRQPRWRRLQTINCPNPNSSLVQLTSEFTRNTTILQCVVVAFFVVVFL